MTSMATISIDLCCNDYRNGAFQGWADDINVNLPNGENIELHGERVRITPGLGCVKVGRVRVYHLGYKDWVGNWCWDSMSVLVSDARRVLNYLKIVRGWSCHCAPSEIFDRWRQPGEITPDEWQEMLMEEAT